MKNKARKTKVHSSRELFDLTLNALGDRYEWSPYDMEYNDLDHGREVTIKIGDKFFKISINRIIKKAWSSFWIPIYWSYEN